MYKVRTIFTLIFVSLQRGRSDQLKNISPGASNFIEPPLQSECHNYSLSSVFYRDFYQFIKFNRTFKSCFHFSPYYYCKEATRTKTTGNLYFKCPCEDTTQCCPPGNLIFDKKEELGSFWECSLKREKLDYWGYLNKAPEGHEPHLLLHNTFYQNNYISNGSTEGQYIIIRSFRPYHNKSNGDIHWDDMYFGPRFYCNVEEMKGDNPRKDLVCRKYIHSIRFEMTYVVLICLCIAVGGATLLVFMLLPPLRTMKTTILLCPTFCSFIVALVQLRYHLGGWQGAYTECIALAYNLHYWDLAVSFWDNIISIDLALTFRGRGFNRKRSRRAFLLYSLYGWGGPLIITLVTAILGFLVTLPPNFVKPDVEFEYCWFHTQEAGLMYHYYPSMVLSAINIPLLGYAVYNIIKSVCTSDILHNEDNGRHVGKTVKKKSRIRLLLYFNLAVLIGSLRTLQPIKNIELLFGSCTLLLFASFCTELARAISVFLLVVCKERVFKLMMERLLCSSVFTSLCSKSYDVKNSKESNSVPQATTPL